jgi:hypothetical protein
MNPVPVRSQPAFRAAILAAVLAATWIYEYASSGDARASLLATALDAALLILVGIACISFFAQFILPIKTLPQRLRISGRLWLHAWGAHGPAVFVQNGRKVERRGESGRRGPGLVWIDTASAALTRTGAGPRRVLGPGIHFTDRNERIEKTFSLHVQSCLIGPDQNEQVFAKIPEDSGPEERARHQVVQSRRRLVSGLTRDGNEVVPEISVTFKLDGQPAPAGLPGSRFGFSAAAVELAARGEGLSADADGAQRTHVAWNQLPGLIAVDLWREYLAKFTLDDLFTDRFEPVPDILQPEDPPEISSPEAGLNRNPVGSAARLLWRLNNEIEHRMRRPPGETDIASSAPRPPHSSGRIRPMPPGRAYTALQVIGYMVRTRMTQAAAPILDECGRYGKGHFSSEEYKRLRERGIRVLDVRLGAVRFAPMVEEQIVKHWKTSWLGNAAREKLHVEQLEALAGEAGKQQALIEHARVLGKALRTESGSAVTGLLRTLLLASHAEILTDERFHGRGEGELEAIAALAKWVDSPNNG